MVCYIVDIYPIELCQFILRCTFYRNKGPEIILIKWQLCTLGLNEIYLWFLLPTYPNFFAPTLNIKMVFGEKIPNMGPFSDFVTIFFVKCYNKI